MLIRKATSKDAEHITTYLLLAMQDIIFNFIGQQDAVAAQKFLGYFVQQENNQYSYQNCWVVEEDGEIIAAANIYDGAQLERLRAPIARYIETNFQKSFTPEDETATGEFYIDTLGVHPYHQGKGIGATLLHTIIEHYVHLNNQTLGLLVDKDNPNAKRLYLKLGFKAVGEKTLAGKHLWHLRIQP